MRKKLSAIFFVVIIVVILVACGSSDNSTPSSSDVPNVTEENSTTGQIENSNDDSSIDSTSTPEPTPSEEPSSVPTSEPNEESTETPAPTETPSPTPTETETETESPTTNNEPESTTKVPDEENENVFEYTIDDGTCTIHGFRFGVDDSKLTEIVIPKEIEGYPVVCIMWYAFWGKSSLTSVVIPEGITSIGDSAFGYCENLTSIVIPESVKFIHTDAFLDSENLTNIEVVPGSYAEKWFAYKLGGNNLVGGWSGNYDTLLSDGFDHIKVPTIDIFYEAGFYNPGNAFDFGNRPEWEEVWYDAYNEFLVANDSPIHPDTGIPIPAFYAINPGSISINGSTYQYLYYGFRGDATNGWGDIVLYPDGLHPTIKDDSNYKDSYILELTNFTYGKMDKGLENEYRAAVTMILSWIVPNPSQVEKAIYDGFVDDNSAIWKHYEANGCGSWMQVGDVDICVAGIHSSDETFMFAIRNHK